MLDTVLLQTMTCHLQYTAYGSFVGGNDGTLIGGNTGGGVYFHVGNPFDPKLNHYVLIFLIAVIQLS